MMKIIEHIPLKVVLPHVLRTNDRISYCKGTKQVSCHRLKQFAVHGCKCRRCGIEGNVVLITKDNGESVHADVYHVSKNCKTLMTRDHIRPSSLGGGNEIWNMRPMCVSCNTKRGNHYDENDKAEYLFNQKWAQCFNWIWNPRKSKHGKFHWYISKVLSRIVKLEWQYKIAKIVAKIS